MGNHYVYILKSVATGKFYVGETSLIPENRLVQHNDAKFPDKYTYKGGPWEMYWYHECSSQSQALKIEKHIKKMKSRVYIENLKLYPEIIDSLLERYKD